MNTIVNLKTMNLQSSDGPVSGVAMGLNIDDLKSAETFIKEAAEKFKLQRMCSPPDTNFMLVTIVTEMPVSVFIGEWNRLTADDQVLSFFMSKMKKADVLRGTSAGQTLETASLIPLV